MKTQIIIYALLVLLIVSCSQSKDVVVMKEFTGDGVAVINFSVQGSMVENGIGKNAADRLTDALFLKKNLRVIDRSKVNDALVDMDIKTSEALSKEQLASLGQKLNARYIVLGRIVQTTDKEFMTSKNDMGLYISFRIVSTENSDVVGMATYKTTYKEDLFKEIDIAMNQLAEEMDL
ncbi:MAG: hypothetical protein IH620_05350 [Ignavibacterium sp.]|nr:hypothetical protein [Ignavibacterium sp.]